MAADVRAAAVSAITTSANPAGMVAANAAACSHPLQEGRSLDCALETTPELYPVDAWHMDRAAQVGVPRQLRKMHA
jgi:hypothetical protein